MPGCHDFKNLFVLHHFLLLPSTTFFPFQLIIAYKTKNNENLNSHILFLKILSNDSTNSILHT